MKASSAVGIENPFTQAFFMRLIGSLLALYATWMLLNYLKTRISERSFNALAFLSLFWCFIPWFHARFSSENISASLFIIGLFSFLKREKPDRTFSLILLAGLLIGLSGVVRFQMNFLVFGFFLWMIFASKENFKNVFSFVCGVVIANAVGILADKWFYGTWEITGWSYLYQNIFLHKAEQFGTEPIWYFFEKIITDGLPPFSILILAAFLWFVFRFPSSVFTWITVAFLFAHLFPAHKELRFLFPLLPFVPVFAVLSYEDIMASSKHHRLKSFLQSKFSRVMKNIFLAANALMLIYLSFKPADEYTPTLKFLYNNYNETPTLMIVEREELNPYSNAVSLSYYRSKNIQPLILPKNVDTMGSDTKRRIIYLSDKNNLETYGNFRLKKVYASLPDFLFKFNFNNWVDRVSKVYIYEVVR